MTVQPYRVVAEFIYRGKRVSPPARWTPPNQEVADRLVAARCLRPLEPGIDVRLANGFDRPRVQALIGEMNSELTQAGGDGDVSGGARADGSEMEGVQEELSDASTLEDGQDSRGAGDQADDAGAAEGEASTQPGGDVGKTSSEPAKPKRRGRKGRRGA